MFIAVDHELADGFQGERTEVAGQGVAVEVFEWAEGLLEFILFGGRKSVRVAIVGLDVGPETDDQLVDGDVVRGGGFRKASAVGFPFGEEAGVLGAAFG
jgi:hypothetical protein